MGAVGRVTAALEELSHDRARDAALRELSRPEYEDARPSLLARAAGRVLRELGELVAGAAGGISGPLGQVLLALLLGGLTAVVLVRLGPLGRRGGPARPVFGTDPARTAQEHRDAAEAAAAAARYADAVRERLRAVVRELEAHGVLDARAGRTAGEVARDAGDAVPALAADLRSGAAVFDAVWYGGRTADRASYDVLAALDDRVRGTRLAGV